MWEERYKQILGRVLDRWTHATIANSGAVKEYLVGKGIARERKSTSSTMGSIQSGSLSRPHPKPPRELGIPTQHRVVGLMARLEPAKDVHTFLQAAAIIATQTKDVHYL